MLDAEAHALRGELFTAAPGTSLPGTYVVVEAADQRACVPAALVNEVVPVLAWVKVAGAPAHVLGSFSYRGRPTLAMDLATLVGSPRTLSLDAHVLVLAAARPIALAVDRVLGLIDSPATLLEDPAGKTGWRASQLVEGFCRDGDSLVPLLRIGALEESAGVGP